jgi:hypothetical protein
MTRLVQIQNGATRARGARRRTAPAFARGVESVYELAQEAVDSKIPWPRWFKKKATDERLDYDPIYDGKSRMALLAPIDHPRNRRAASFPARA